MDRWTINTELCCSLRVHSLSGRDQFLSWERSSDVKEKLRSSDVINMVNNNLNVYTCITVSVIARPRLLLPSLFEEFYRKFTCLSKKYNWNQYKGRKSWSRFLLWHFIYFYKLLREINKNKNKLLIEIYDGKFFLLFSIWNYFGHLKQVFNVMIWYFRVCCSVKIYFWLCITIKWNLKR